MSDAHDLYIPSESEIGQRRFLTLMFADLCESSRLARLVDAEEFAAVLRRLRQAARVVIRRHGGMVARIQGDGVLAIFGYPTPNEDESRRAVEASLELRDEINALRIGGHRGAAARIGLHTGIHAGLVYMSEGDIERGRYDLVGHTVNTAARLCSMAADGEICVSMSALGPVDELFVGGLAEDVPVKGQDEWLRVRNITGRAPFQRRFDASVSKGLARLVGRDAAWGRLESAWQRVQANGAGCVVVTGQAGLGKSRLIEEFARCDTVRHALVFRGFCESYLSAEPLQPFLHVMQAAAASGIQNVPNEKELSPLELRASFLRWLEQSAAQRPTLLVLDDWQWADDLSRQLLDRVLALQAPLLVLVACRTAAGAALDGHSHDTVELEALTPDDARKVVRHWLPTLDPLGSDELHAYSGGIPLFVEELCHAVAAGGHISAGTPQSGTAWLGSLVASRIARLNAEAANLLRIASVLGNAFPAELLAHIAGTEYVERSRPALQEQEFLFPAEQPGFWRFKHGFIRDTVYATVALADRKHLHGQVAALLDRARSGNENAVPESLAYHLSAAGDFGLAARYAEAAGDKAMASNALDRARDQYGAALRDLDAQSKLSREDMAAWCGVAQKLGMACVFDPISIADRERLLERAVALASGLRDANLQARADYWLGYARYAVGHAKRGLSHCRRALALAESSGDARLAAQVRATLGQALTAVCRYDEALPLLNDAIATKRRAAGPGGSTAIGSAYALACKGLLLTDRGEFEPARDCFSEARLLLGDSGHPVASSVCGLMGIALTWQSRWDEAIAVANEGARVATNSRSRQLLAMGHSIAGYARWVSRGDAGGLEAIREAVHWIEQRSGRFMISLLYGWLVEADVQAGDEGTARRHAARLLLRARDGDGIGEAMGARAMTRLSMANGRLDEASRWLKRAEHSASRRNSPHEAAHNQIVQSELAAANGNDDARGSALLAAHHGYERLSLHWHLARSRSLLAAKETTAH